MPGQKLYNAFWILQHGKVQARVLKHDLPHKQLFDELACSIRGHCRAPIASMASASAARSARMHGGPTWPRRWPKAAPKS